MLRWMDLKNPKLTAPGGRVWEIHYGAMSTLGCGIPTHAEALSHLGGKAAQVSHPTSH